VTPHSRSDGQDLLEQVDIATLVGDLIAALPGPGTSPSGRVSEAVAMAAWALCAGIMVALERPLGVPKHTVWEWRTGAARPLLRILLRLATVLSMSLRQLLCESLVDSDIELHKGGTWLWNTGAEAGRRPATRRR
jgi:hypothetical protein